MRNFREGKLSKYKFIVLDLNMRVVFIYFRFGKYVWIESMCSRFRNMDYVKVYIEFLL